MIPNFDPGHMQQIRELLKTPQQVIITTHHKPDGDAMGASLALCHFLNQHGHRATVITPSDYPDFLYWMPGNETVINFEYNPGKSKQLTENATVIFCLDFNAASRLEKYSESVTRSNAFKILIDHHMEPESFCDITFSYPDACSTCELVYYFITGLNGITDISKTIAECLYTGIMTDTGSFRFASMTADTHMIVAELMRAGASNFMIHENVYDNFSLERTRFLGHCIKDRLIVLPEYKTAYIAVSKEELIAFNHRSGDTEGVVNYALGIKGIRFAAFFCERDNLIKISFRSKDDFSVNDVARKYFSGGGHRNAAGGRSTDSLENTISKFLALLPGLKNELNP